VYGESDFGIAVDMDDLAANDYALHPDRYREPSVVFENGGAFGSVMQSISRGAPCMAKDLDRMSSHEKTDLRFLLMNDIRDGIMNEPETSLAFIDDKFAKYQVRDGDLIISKNGYPYKIAVATVRDGLKVIASGNLYVIRVDSEKADPYYLKAFFESEQGRRSLDRISVGTVLKNIGVDSLKKLEIPLPPVEIQRKFAEEYRRGQEHICRLQEELELRKKELAGMYDKFPL
ncbi:MAG: restriction endonuclease subunit S, partial [Parasporobacterium sp.]|nr:restriction endonuclease subunit S [Parasporobacterium sp.]